MSKDIQIMPIKEGLFTFTVQGAADDSAALLLQRVFTLLLASSAYRTDNSGDSLLSFLEGGNYPDAEVMNPMLMMCCTDTLYQLSEDDQERISSLVGEWIDNNIQCTLTFVDGTSITGAIHV